MIDILLATYNGAKYLPQQIDSILRQDHNFDWRLIVRDDGSNDETLSLLNDYKEQLGEKMTLIEDGQHLGVIKSFETLLAHSTADYIMFCDQDDVWHLDKISRSMEVLLEAENRCGKAFPLALHTDLRVVDEVLNEVAPSFWEMTNIRPAILDSNPQWLGFCNSVTGCTLLINKALKERVLPFPNGIAMHDAHIAITAAMSGRLIFVDEQMVDYRQHSKNICGAERYRFSFWGKIKNIKATYNKIVEARLCYPYLYKNGLHFWWEKVRYFSKLHIW